MTTPKRPSTKRARKSQVMSRGGSTRSKTRRVPKGQIDPYRSDKQMGRTIDFTGVGEYKPVPNGPYTVEFTKYEFVPVKSGKNAGGEQVKAQWTIVDELAADGETKTAGKVIFRNYQLTQAALWVLKSDAVAVGIEPSRMEGAGVDIEAILADMVGRRGIAEVTTESYTYPEGHAKAGQTRQSNTFERIEQAELPDVLTPAGRRR